MNNVLSKNGIREQIRKHRWSLNTAQIYKMSHSVSMQTVSSDLLREANTILLYWPLPGEVDLRNLISMGAKRVALPVVIGPELILREYSPEYMVIGAFNIHEPDSRAPIITPEEIDLAIIPGVAFDKKCNRLGRGKGFYDRLLPLLHCPKIGVAFDFQIYDNLPVDPWDIPMDFVVTESSIFQIAK